MAKQLLSPEEHSLVLQVIRTAQPDELAITEDLLRPSPWWSRFRSGSGPAGYGAEAVVPLIGPTTIVVVAWVYGVVHREAKPILEERIGRLTREYLGRVLQPSRPDHPEALSLEELEPYIAEYAQALGMKNGKSMVLAAAVIKLIRQGKD